MMPEHTRWAAYLVNIYATAAMAAVNLSADVFDYAVYASFIAVVTQQLIQGIFVSMGYDPAACSLLARTPTKCDRLTARFRGEALAG